jgi:hypothetical protein
MTPGVRSNWSRLIKLLDWKLDSPMKIEMQQMIKWLLSGQEQIREEIHSGQAKVRVEIHFIWHELEWRTSYHVSPILVTWQVISGFSGLTDHYCDVTITISLCYSSSHTQLLLNNNLSLSSSASFSKAHWFAAKSLRLPPPSGLSWYHN